MLRCLKYTSLNSKLLVIYFANFVELGGYCPKTGYFRFLSFIPNSCHKTLINVTFERGSEKVTFFPWFWYMILPTTNNELGNKTRKKEKMGGYYPGWRYNIWSIWQHPEKSKTKVGNSCERKLCLHLIIFWLQTFFIQGTLL